ncbi:hypothetical protein KC140_14030 [Listeria monocytogenes]|uniref:hypothetical protein n=1 Tax=Listeria monocytogenes TaxID=1639 RepID=UPI00073C949B|nr:hypothetical protein [Listeria monocytogenes]ASH85353.1 hypothetical protein N882_2303 [Listeria monocytogenes serotype 1/2a str. 01-1468]EAC2668128.1 hypothetical protein [Listeria monocytogenes]EAC2738455.1 hypothetical protein [Listeria monocytogenes]EAC3227273.1 hypothetical protein [Listeria monocytogenes]EAC3242862.1 hypothetical protein [Listeria monocytogenes]
MNMSTEIIMTEHAIKRAKERLKIPADTAPMWAENRLKGKNATRMTGKDTYEYEVGSVTFVVTHNNNKAIVRTCYKTIDDPLKQKVARFLDKEFNKAKRAYNKVNKELLNTTALLYSQISDETAKLARTKNPLAVSKISESLQKLHTELEKVQTKRNEAEKELKIMRTQADKLIDI